jgi:hypothetical protein
MLEPTFLVPVILAVYMLILAAKMPAAAPDAHIIPFTVVKYIAAP